MQRTATKSLVLPLLLAGILCACTPAGSSPPAAAPALPAAGATDPFVIEGYFLGWKGDCAGPPPVTRSDWMLEYDGACRYVTGPLPAGLDPLRPKRQTLRLRGHWEETGDGRAFFRLRPEP